MGSLLVGCFYFSFSFSADGQIRLHFYFFQTPRIPVGLCSLVFPLPFLFILTFSNWLPLYSAFPPSLSPFYLLVYNSFAVRLSLWFTGPLLSRSIINGLLCCAPAGSPPLRSLGQAPCKHRMLAACTKARAHTYHISPLHLFLARCNEKSQVIHLRPN